MADATTKKLVNFKLTGTVRTALARLVGVEGKDRTAVISSLVMDADARRKKRKRDNCATCNGDRKIMAGFVGESPYGQVRSVACPTCRPAKKAEKND